MICSPWTWVGRFEQQAQSRRTRCPYNSIRWSTHFSNQHTKYLKQETDLREISFLAGWPTYYKHIHEREKFLCSVRVIHFTLLINQKAIICMTFKLDLIKVKQFLWSKLDLLSDSIKKITVCISIKFFRKYLCMVVS